MSKKRERLPAAMTLYVARRYNEWRLGGHGAPFSEAEIKLAWRAGYRAAKRKAERWRLK